MLTIQSILRHGKIRKMLNKKKTIFSFDLFQHSIKNVGVTFRFDDNKLKLKEKKMIRVGFFFLLLSYVSLKNLKGLIDL